MNLFKQPRSDASPETLRQIKTWVAAALNLPADVPISISQLRCHERGCPPVETVISVMTQPVQTYKIHQPIAAVQQADILQRLQNSSCSK
ncbi:hypothetical protein [Sphaerothrix gracilis]|uniref:hypothetical protein n=1 Tax=Sphaerothrix gracilis TaxID=3151835 RepID=UPI0031FC94B9